MLRPLLLVFLLACQGATATTSGPAPDAATCARIASDASLPPDVATADTLRTQGRTWTDQQIRASYVCRVSAIGADDARWKAEGKSAEERAHLAFETRHTARVVARAMMVDRAEVAGLQARDQAKYGNPDGPTFEWLVAKGQADGRTGDALYEGIIASAQRTDDATNKRFGL